MSFRAKSVTVGNLGEVAEAAIQINATDRGFLPPRLTNAEVSTMTNVDGLLVYNTDEKQLYKSNGSDWRPSWITATDSIKKPVSVATTANIADVLTGAPNVVDGITLVVGSTILVKDQTDNTQNGVYEVGTVGTGSDGVWARSNLWSVADEIHIGTQVVVASGDTNAFKSYYVASDIATVGTSAWTWGERNVDLTATIIDSSSGPVALTLPSATGSGQVLWYINQDLTNPAIIGVEVGEFINESLNGTFNFADWPVGTQFRATDRATGQWAIGVDVTNNSTFNSWTTATYYVLGDPVVTPGGGVVIRSTAGTSGVAYDAVEAANWTYIGALQNTTFNWQASTYYYTGQILLQNNILIRLSGAPGVSETTFNNTEAAKWTIVSQLVLSSWAQNTTFMTGQKISVNGEVYSRVASGSDSGANFELHSAAWSLNLIETSFSGYTDRVLSGIKDATSGTGYRYRVTDFNELSQGYRYSFTDADGAAATLHQIDLDDRIFSNGETYQFQVTVFASATANHTIELGWSDGANTTTKLINVGIGSVGVVAGGSDVGNVVSSVAVGEVNRGGATNEVELNLILTWSGASTGTQFLTLKPAYNNDGTAVENVAAADSITVIRMRAGAPTDFSSDLAATIIDASVTSVTETLTGATGSGDIKFYATSNVTNNATLAVQPGESLNDTTDGAFLFSNYTAGTQFRATDIAAGKWVVAVVGQLGTTERNTITALPTAVSYVSGSTTIIYNTTPSAGQMSVNGVSYYDEGTRRYVLIEMEMADDDGVVLEVDTTVIPSGASIMSAFGNLLDDTTNIGQHAPQVAILSTNQFYLNKVNSVDAVFVRIHMVVDNAAAGQVVLAGMVPVSNLARTYIQQRGSTKDTAVLTVTTGSTANWNTLGGLILFTATDANDTSGLTIGTNTVTIDTTGVYEITFNATFEPTIASSAMLQVTNGTSVLSTASDVEDSGRERTASVNYKASITAGTVLDFRVQSSTSSMPITAFSINIEQQPTSEVVLPEALTPTTLARCRLYRNAALSIAGSSVTTIAYDTANYNIGGIGDTSTGAVTIATDGTYRISSGWHNDPSGASSNNIQVQIFVDGVLFHRGGDAKASGGGNIWVATDITVFLLAGQVITSAAFSSGFAVVVATGSINLPDAAYLEVIEIPNSSVVAFEPDQLEAKTLSYGRLFGQPTNKTYVSTSPGSIVDFPNSDGLVGVTVASNSFTVSQSGRYSANIFVPLRSINQDGVFNFVINGGTIVATYNPDVSATNDDNGRLTGYAEFDLIAGDAVALYWQADANDALTFDTASTPYFYLRQLPTTEVVQPGSLTVTDRRVLLGSATGLADTNTFSISQSWGSLSPTYETVELQLTGTFGGDSYRFEHTVRTSSWIDGTRVSSFSDGVNNLFILGMDIAGTTGTISAANFSNISVEVYGHIPQKNVIDNSSTVVDDQSASGYIDIGTMRMQWGNVTGVAGTQTITFPAPFANANYTITGGSRNVISATGDLTLQSNAYTTTTFDGLLQFHDAGANAIINAIDDWQWIAIGLKP